MTYTEKTTKDALLELLQTGAKVLCNFDHMGKSVVIVQSPYMSMYDDILHSFTFEPDTITGLGMFVPYWGAKYNDLKRFIIHNKEQIGEDAYQEELSRKFQENA